eukprot:gb/GECH01003281.1/.p1 GENE.gb/GECH01003281.1/~~gb/GECH01003281.1/.p1  ORF type:complete len:521 (+),score=142.48 gb/GECH01003281.1/:1-1563(+)
MVEKQTILIALAAIAAVGGITYYATSSSEKKMITEEEGDKKKRRTRQKKASSSSAASKSAAKKSSTSTPTSSSTNKETEMKEWKFEPLGIKVQVPKDWTPEEATEAATFITKFSGLTHEKSQALIVVESHQERISPEAFLEKFKEVAQGMLPVNFEKEEPVDFAGRKGYEAVYTQDLSRFGQSGVIKNYVCLTTIRNLGLCFQFTASSSDFDDDIDVVKKSARTLEMTPPPSTSSVTYNSEDGFSFDVPSIQYDSSKSPLKVSEDYEVITHLEESGEESASNSITVVKLTGDVDSLDKVVETFKEVFSSTAERKDQTVLNTTGALFTYDNKKALCFVINNKGYIIQIKGSDADSVLDSIKSEQNPKTSMHFRNTNLGMEFDYPPSMNVSEGVRQVTVTSSEGHPFSGLTRTSFEVMEQPLTLDTLSQLIDREVSEMSQQGMSIKVNSKDTTTVGDKEALRVDMDQTNPYIEVGVKELKTFVSTSNGVVSITSSTTKETYDETDKVSQTFLEIADSFRSTE